MRATANSGRDNMTDYLKIDNQRIAYTTTGSPSNPAIIFVHGLMSHRGVWTKTVESLKEKFFCIALDLLGFGDSDKPNDGDYSIAAQADRVLKLANYSRLRQFSLVGHSMGGQIASYLAVTQPPQRIDKLVSVDGVVTGGLSDQVQNITNPEIADSTPKAWDSLNAIDLTPMLENITVPTLVIFGKEDGTVPIEQAYLFKAKLPAAQLILIDQCGHFPMHEAFDTYMSHLQEFLNQPAG